MPTVLSLSTQATYTGGNRSVPVTLQCYLGSLFCGCCFVLVSTDDCVSSYALAMVWELNEATLVIKA